MRSHSGPANWVRNFDTESKRAIRTTARNRSVARMSGPREMISGMSAVTAHPMRHLQDEAKVRVAEERNLKATLQIEVLEARHEILLFHENRWSIRNRD